MASSLLQLKSNDLLTQENRAQIAVAVVGCNALGVLHACLFAEAGFKVTCIDGDQATMVKIAKTKPVTRSSEPESDLRKLLREGKIKFDQDPAKIIPQSQVILLTIGPRVTQKEKVSHFELERVIKKTGENLRSGSLVISVSQVGIGLTDSLFKPALENASGLKTGIDFGLVYSPSPREWSKTRSRIMGTQDETSLNAGCAILKTIAPDGLFATETFRVAEAASLFDTFKKEVDASTLFELATLSEKLNLDFHDVRKFMSNDLGDGSDTPVRAKGVSDHEFLLMEEIEDLNMNLRIPLTVRRVKDDVSKHAVNMIKDALRVCGKAVMRSRVTVLGVSSLLNAKGSLETTVGDLLKTLDARGARITVHDPYFTEDDFAQSRFSFKRDLTESVEKADCVVLATAHDQFKRLNMSKLKVVMKSPPALVDLEGTMEPEKAEKEGFIYRGLGRGVLAK